MGDPVCHRRFAGQTLVVERVSGLRELLLALARRDVSNGCLGGCIESSGDNVACIGDCGTGFAAHAVSGLLAARRSANRQDEDCGSRDEATGKCQHRLLPLVNSGAFRHPSDTRRPGTPNAENGRPARVHQAFAFGLVGSSAVLIATAPVVAAAAEHLPAWKAVILGLVEGITEFLPISSTGHLLVAERLLDLGTTKTSLDAIDAYTVIVQLGAIVAVLVVSWRRVLDVFNGLIGRSEKGRKLLINLIVSFLPAAVIGFVGKKLIEEHLLKPIPVAAAWIVGGVAILLLATRYRSAASSGSSLDQLTIRNAAIIGFAQAVAMWPGVSRSLITILAAVLIGMKLRDAVEYSFLLGLLTLGAASVYSILKDGSLVGDTYGWSSPILGMVVAFVSALIAVKWMVAYLNHRDLTIFGWYRLAAGAACIALVVSHTI